MIENRALSKFVLGIKKAQDKEFRPRDRFGKPGFPRRSGCLIRIQTSCAGMDAMHFGAVTVH